MCKRMKKGLRGAPYKKVHASHLQNLEVLLWVTVLGHFRSLCLSRRGMAMCARFVSHSIGVRWGCAMEWFGAKIVWAGIRVASGGCSRECGVRTSGAIPLQ